MSRLNFTLEKQASGSQARAASFTTLHGPVQTPIFMPVGTQATVKSQTRETLKETRANILLANTYHLMLRPGPEVFEKFGGIHKFMNRDRPVLTDSGGFQIFSLPHARRMDEEGAQFQSYVDGTTHLLSPEKSIRMQRAIGSDIMMVLDQCIPSTSGHAEARAAMDLTHRWAVRSLKAREDSPQSMFGIVQGACFHDLRKQSADFLTQLPFDGFAIGGLAVGEGMDLRNEFTEATAQLLPNHLPRYLMGVGTPIDLLEGVHRGVDMFDCILPLQFAQRGAAFTTHGKLQLRRTVHRFSDEPLDARCDCKTCRDYSRGYLHHLIKADEILGWHLIGYHNLLFYQKLMAEMREAILADRFTDYYRARKPELLLTDEDNPAQPPKRTRTPTAVRRLSLGDYEVHLAQQGHANIRQKSSGEIMHSVSDPAEEARRLYIEQPRLRERLLTPFDQPLVIWDVGLGGASNAMAAIHCAESLLAELSGQDGRAPRTLKIVSFERDLDPFRLTIRNADRFQHIRHKGPSAVLETGQWSHPSGLIEWRLFEGDFLDHFEKTEAPDLIFYDPFSFKVDSPLWSLETFEKVRRHALKNPSPAELLTYSASTAVRSTLLAAGFHVSAGVGTGPKAETTRAFTRHPGVDIELLGDKWLERWKRSTARTPAGLTETSQAELEARILAHPQFNS